MKIKATKQSLALLLPVLLALLPSACVKNGQDTPGAGTQDLCELRFSSGDAATKALTPFSTDAQVELLIFQREDAEVSGFTRSGKMYTAKGSIASGGTSIAITEVDGEPGSIVQLPKLQTYDIFAVCNASPLWELYRPDGSARALFGSLQGSYISGFQNGWSVLCAAKTVTIGAGDDSFEVSLGDMPHMNTAVCAQVRLEDAILEDLKVDGKVAVGLNDIQFNNCLPSGANVGLSDSPAYTVIPGAYNTSYDLYPATSTSADITTVVGTYTSDLCYLLPCPRKAAGVNNVYDITFNLTLNGFGAALEAPAVELPPLLGGYKYTFTMIFKSTGAETGHVDLLLSVDPWDSVSVVTTEGDYQARYFQNLRIGGWNNVTYAITEGDYGDDIHTRISVSDFTSVSWASSEGRYE